MEIFSLHWMMQKITFNASENPFQAKDFTNTKKSNVLNVQSKLTTSFQSLVEVRMAAKIRNRYNQVPDLTQATSGKVTKTIKHHK